MIRAALLRSRPYWRSREFARRLSIRGSWFQRQATDRIGSWGTGAAVIGALLWRSVWVIAADILLLLVVQAAAWWIGTRPLLSLPWATVDFSWWSANAIDGYRELLTLIGSVSGVVLALYFTALTTVMQAGYRDVAESVRQVLLRDTYGNTYVSLLTTTIGMALVLIW